MLVEVMVGAVVLAIATTALLNGIDGAQSAGAQNKARSTAAALAEQDQERMRAMPVASLVGYSATRTVTVRGVNYTVVSGTQWVTEAGGPISCSNNSKTAANVRIASQVSSNATKGVVSQVGLVTPPAGTFATGEGRAIVKVVDRNGDAVSGASVSLSGAGSFSGTTNSLGCVIFPFIPVGSYTASVSGLSLVDWQGTTPTTKGLGVTQSTSTVVSLEMDTAAEIRAIFDTQVGSTVVAAKSQWLTLGNSKLTVGSKTFSSSTGAPNTTVIAQNLFPFLDGYAAYAGQCTANSPTSDPIYSPTPGQVLTMTTSNDIRVPAINVQVVNTSSTPVNGATVFVKSADSGCANTFPSQVTAAMTYAGITYQGVLPEPGFPFGNYKLCAQNSTATVHGHADIRSSFSGYSDNSTSVATETAFNTVDETVPNNSSAGSSLTWSSGSGALRIRLSRSGPCH